MVLSAFGGPFLRENWLERGKGMKSVLAPLEPEDVP